MDALKRKQKLQTLPWYALNEIAKKLCIDEKKINGKEKSAIISKIDWYGENAGQGRECWFYTDVYEIYGTDKAEAVAVEVNNNYYIAKLQ